MIREGGDATEFQRGYDMLIENANVGVLFYNRKTGRFHSEGFNTWIGGEQKPLPLEEVLRPFKLKAEKIEHFDESLLNI